MLLRNNLIWENQQGFLLMEVCIVLSVVGILVGAGSSLLKGYYRRQQDMCTQTHQTQILNALVWFVLREKRLPCPASYESNGVSLVSCSEHWKGIVPFRSLGLPERVAKDGLGSWMSFIVEPALTEHSVNVSSALGVCRFILGTKSTLEVIEKDTSLTQYTKQDGIVVVIISHGKYGNFSKSTSPNISDCTAMNREQRKTYCSAPGSQDKGMWNDTVVFLTKRQLLQEMGLKCTDYFLPSETFEPVPYTAPFVSRAYVK